MSVGMVSNVYSVDIPRCWCDASDNSNATLDICTWVVFIVVPHVMLHMCCGISKLSQIWVNKGLSNNITDGGVSY